MSQRGTLHFCGLAMLTILVGAPCLAEAASRCPIERAEYAMVGSPDVTGGFRPVEKHADWASNVAFYVVPHAQGKEYWFLFDQGSARYVNMIPTGDVRAKGWAPPSGDGGPKPIGEMHYLASDDSVRFSLQLPQQGQPAPEYVLLPDLSEMMWYRAQPRTNVPVAELKFRACNTDHGK